MSESYDDKLCENKHSNIEKTLNDHEKRLNNHSARLDGLEQYKSKSEERMDNLCKQLEKLVSSIYWFMGIIAGGFVGFFFYAIQTHLFK